MTDPTEPRGDLVPGVMSCAKCKFQLVRTNLYVRSGMPGPGDSKTEPCPNGCGPLWPVTWRQWAEEAQVTAERFFDEAKAEREKAERLRARVAELEQTIKRQASAAISGMNAAKSISSAQLERARKLRAESSPEALESERAANALLTARVEELERDAARYRHLRDDAGNGIMRTLMKYASADAWDRTVDAAMSGGEK